MNPKDKKAYLEEHINFINKYPNKIWSKIFELEEDFKKYFKVNYASACSSWSTWLILALKTIWIKKWDEVLINCNYFISDPNSVKILWWKPIFIDLWQKINSLSLNDIKLKITNKTKAIIIIHLDWYPIENTKDIINICKEKNIKIIEDCCQSIWAKIWNDYIWTLWDLWVFSFDSNKIVKWWEWWMVISNNKELIEKINLYKNNYKKEWLFKKLWYNFRYNDFSAIYAKYSLKNITNFLNMRYLFILELKKKSNMKVYECKWITPIYYNLIIERKNTDLLSKKDFYNLNINDFPNFNKLYSKYKIIELPKNNYSEF